MKQVFVEKQVKYNDFKRKLEVKQFDDCPCQQQISKAKSKQ